MNDIQIEIFNYIVDYNINLPLSCYYDNLWRHLVFPITSILSIKINIYGNVWLAEINQSQPLKFMTKEEASLHLKNFYKNKKLKVFD